MTLSTGKYINANRGIIGLGPELTTIYDGYDGVIDDVDPDYRELSKIERIEIANIMIKRWMDYRELALKE
jgi:hypothetical protein